MTDEVLGIAEHQLHALAFRTESAEDLRVIRLRHAEVEVPVELLAAAVMMRVVNLRRSLVCTRIARLQELPAVDHVLVEDCMIDEATEPVEDVAAVHAADV